MLLYLLQLVQALKFENISDKSSSSSLAEFLIERAIKNPILGNNFHWLVNNIYRIHYGDLWKKVMNMSDFRQGFGHNKIKLFKAQLFMYFVMPCKKKYLIIIMNLGTLWLNAKMKMKPLEECMAKLIFNS